MVARPEVVVKFILILVCLDVVCHSARSRFYLPLQILSKPGIVDVIWELWRVHDLDRVSILLGDLEATVTLALNAKGVIVQLLRREMR